MVDVDDFTAVFLAKPSGQNLHEASKNGKLNILFFKDGFDLLEAGLFVVAIKVDVVKRDACLFGYFLTVVSIAYDGGDFDGHFAKLGPP